MYDADSNEINVGDLLVDGEGKEFTVNKYGHIVTIPYAFCDTRKPRCFTIKRKWCDKGDEVKLPPVPTEEVTSDDLIRQRIVDDIFNESASKTNGMSDMLSLSQATDLELKKELESRGWTVKATKEIMVPQTIEL